MCVFGVFGYNNHLFDWKNQSFRRVRRIQKKTANRFHAEPNVDQFPMDRGENKPLRGLMGLKNVPTMLTQLAWAFFQLGFTKKQLFKDL